MPNYSTEHLLLFWYRETSKDESAAIEKELLTDWALKEKLDVLNSHLRSLDTLLESPRTQSVSAILDYARVSAEVV